MKLGSSGLMKIAFRNTLPVMAGYLVLGFGFGVLLNANGYGVLWAFAMSFLIYAGSMQFLAVNLLTGGASLLTCALTTLAVNARHLFYGLSMTEEYKKARKEKFYLIFGLTDETYSLLCRIPDNIEENSRIRYCFYVTLLDHIYWVSGSVLGSLFGKTFQIPTNGIDFSLTALFITVMVEQWMSTKNHRSAIIGVVSSIAALLLFGSDRFLILAMAFIALLLLLMRKRAGENGKEI